MRTHWMHAHGTTIHVSIDTCCVAERAPTTRERTRAAPGPPFGASTYAADGRRR
jgi:hypothetical protein